ncbi:MAG: hypothetical protein HOH97_05290 [Thiotrichales bacterium]|nr:hypothetical protein [Thiotrichales bacterium]MBT3614061.1 hypothetical protein [Thiotrichales bacterium]MBT4260880.1 hypothetical protein [Thiotrichales bacterium]MBT5290538.1 hypothetical protein [Thiotrichales bacterium]MBT5417817.1 hypothetical protein [Thiotrichales bacterium]
MLKLFSSWSIGTQAFWVMLLVSFTLLGVGVTSFSRTLYSSQLKHLEEDIEKRTALFSTTLLDAIISEDLPVLETTLQGLKQIHPNLIGAEFCNYRRDPILSWGTNIPSCTNNFGLESESPFEIITTSRKTIIFEGENFGSIALRWDLSQPFKVLKDRVFQFTLSLSAASLLLVLTLFIVIKVLVVRPIGRIDRYLRSVEQQVVDSKSSKKYGSKEMIHLCEGVDILHRSMLEEYKLREEREYLLATLEDKVDERTKELKLTNNQLSSIMNNMVEALFVIDSTRQVMIHNPAATKLFTTLSDNLVDSGEVNFISLFPSSVQPQIEKILINSTSQHIEENIFIETGGTKNLLELSTAPLSSNTLILLRDITLQRELEERRQMESFQSGVAEMSITIMHNIGNILAGLVGQIHKVKKGGESINRVTTLLMQLLEKFDEVPVDKQRKVIAKSVELIDDKLRGDIVKPARHLEKGVNSISEIIRLQKSNIKPIFQLTNFQPRTLINDVVIMLEPQHKVNRIAISIDITDEIHELYLPRNQLFQVLVNIVKNSIEAIAESKLKNGEGKIVIQLTKSKVDKVAGYLFTVEDNGIGIDSAQLKDLFQFGKSSKKDGSGVGLHSSGNFANSFGGKMWVDSDGVERGASSNVWLPLQQRIKV